MVPSAVGQALKVSRYGSPDPKFSPGPSPDAAREGACGSRDDSAERGGSWRMPWGQRKRELSAFSDVLMALCAYLVLLRLHVRVALMQGDLGTWYALLVVLIAATWWFLSAVFRREVSWRTTSPWADLRDTLIINLLGALIVLAASLMTHHVGVSRLVLAGFPVASFVVTGVLRACARWGVQERRRRGRDLKEVLLVGPAQGCAATARAVLSPASGLRLTGVLVPPGEEQAARTSGLAVVGGYGDLRDVLHREVVDQVGLSGGLDNPDLRGVLQAALEEGKTVWLHLDAFWSEVLGYRNRGDRVVMVSPSIDALGAGLKRGIDLVGATLGLCLLSPVLVGCAAAIKMAEPRHPVIFRQRRIGLHGRCFTLYKFRTMVPDAEAHRAELLGRNEMDGPVFKIRADPRITAVGRVLRRYSLDELPQLWNVIKGDMSLVGPRPPLPDEVQAYEAQYRRRLAFRPGLTCLWQVAGRNQVPFARWMELDLEYVDNWSLQLDVQILLHTLPTLVRGTGT